MNNIVTRILIIYVMTLLPRVLYPQAGGALGEHYSRYDVSFYHIKLTVTNVSTNLAGSTQMNFKTAYELDSVTLELSNLLEVSKVMINGKDVFFQHQNDLLTAFDTINPGVVNELDITYEGIGGDEFFSGVFNGEGPANKNVTYTLSEPYGAKFWFPCKQDLTDKIDSVKLALTCPDSVQAVSIGMLDTVRTLPGNRHQYIWTSNYPISYYLPAFTTGDFLNYSQQVNIKGNEMLFQNYIYNDSNYFHEQRANIDTTVFLLNLYSDMFGGYPFIKEKYGHVTAPIGGGMEHQTMTTLRHFGFNLVAHELAHQWFGDQVTCGQWNDIWLNEGFASYSEYLALEHVPGAKRRADWLEREFAIASRDYMLSIHVPDIELDNPFRIFNRTTTYAKGSVILHMMRNIIADDKIFFDILKRYIADFSYGTAVFDDFKQIVEDVSGRSWDTFFEQWYYGHGYPVYNIFYRQDNDSLHIISQQLENDTARFFETPLVIQVKEEDTTYTRTIEHKNSREEHVFPLYGKLLDIAVDPERDYLQHINRLIEWEGNKNSLLLSLFPNPVEDQLHLMFSQKQTDPVTIEIYSHGGKKIYVQNNIIPGPEHRLPVQRLSAGIYYLRVRSGDHSETHAFVKL